MREIDTAIAGPVPKWLTEKKPRMARQAHSCLQCDRWFSMPRSLSIDEIDKAGYFCTLRCAAQWAVKTAQNDGQIAR